MVWRLGNEEFAALLRTRVDKRYAYFVKHAADEGQLWSLRSPGGWVLASTETGREAHPVWPHQLFAEASATGEWHDAAPHPISIRDWLEVWTPGMVQAGRGVIVFPTPTDGGALTEPENLATRLDEELALLE